MKKRWIVLSSIFVLIIPFIAITMVLLFNKNVFDNADFWYSYMAYFGTIILASVALWQNQTANEINENYDNMNALQNYCFARVTSKIDIKKNGMVDKKITISAMHKADAQAIILLEKTDISEVVTFNEYLVELYFEDYSKSAIKSFRIDVEQMVCVQEANKDGLIFGKTDEHTPIPVGFEILFLDAITYPVWVGNDTFKIQIKMYAKSKGVLDHIIDNTIPFCLIFKSILTSVSGITTSLKYKLWIDKNSNNFSIQSNETQLLEIKSIKNKSL